MNKIKFSNASKKFLKNCEKKLRKRILKTIEDLVENPYPPRVIKLVGKEKVFRVRVGDYRILYEFYPQDKIILIVKIDKRSRVYD